MVFLHKGGAPHDGGAEGAAKGAWLQHHAAHLRGGAYWLFHWLDENASDEAKAALSRTMAFKDYKSEKVASALVEIFDRIYTYPLLRWRAFLRSLLFTTVVLAIYFFEIGEFATAPWKWSFQSLRFFMTLWATAFLFNIFSDYLSLFVIRPFLVRSGTKPVIGLSLGAVSGAAIVLAGNFLRAIVIIVIVGFVTDVVDVFYSVEDGVRPNYSNRITMESFRLFMMFSWPALFVFAWLPLFALGIVAARVLTPMSWIVGRAQWLLKEGKEHPLKAIGCVAAVVVFLGTVAGRAVFSA